MMVVRERTGRGTPQQGADQNTPVDRDMLAIWVVRLKGLEMGLGFYMLPIEVGYTFGVVY